MVIGCSGICMAIAAELLAVPLAQIFVGYDMELMDLTVSGLRIFAIAFPFWAMPYSVPASLPH